jgi:hypothetical protein
VSSSRPPPAVGGCATPAASSRGRPRPAAQPPHRRRRDRLCPGPGGPDPRGPVDHRRHGAVRRRPPGRRPPPGRHRPFSTWDACASRSPGRCATAWRLGRPSSCAGWSAPAPTSSSTTKAGAIPAKTEPRSRMSSRRRQPTSAEASAWIDDPSNASSPASSGADQIDAEHQATELAVGGSNPSRRAQRLRSTAWAWFTNPTT